jgi:hypothetical protein
MRKIALPAAFAGIIALCASFSAAAADEAALGLMRVLVVQTADVSTYAHEVENLQALLKKAGQTSRIRVWQATYAGADAGSVVVSIEVANLAALAKLNDAIKTNADLAAEMKKIGGMRKIVSDSLYDLVGH